MRRINMDNNNVALITKMVLEAVEKQKSSEKEPGYLVPVDTFI
jgi:putative phosphotransacetylase